MKDNLFIAFLVLLVWLPIPRGSVPDWAWLLACVAVFTLLLLYILQYLRGSRRVPILPGRSRAIFLLWLLWLGLIILQIIPLPASWLQILSPERLTHLPPVPALPTGLPVTVSTGDTLYALLKSFSYAGIFTLTLLFAYRRTHVRLILYVLVLSGFLQACYGVVMTLSGWEYGFFAEKVYNRGLATGTFVNRNHLAGYLIMCLASGIGLLIARLNPSGHESWRQHLREVFRWLLSGKMALRLMLICMVVALVMTHSRMGNSAFFSALLLAGVLALWFWRRHAPRTVVILLGSLIIIDMVIAGTWFGLEKVGERLIQTSMEREPRDEVARNTYRYWQDYLFIGSGLGTYSQVYPHYQQQEIQQFYAHAHNDLLEFPAETGVAGSAILGSILVSSLIVALLAQYRRRDALWRGVAFGAGMAIIGLTIHSSVDFNLQIPANAMTFMVILALAWVARYFPRHGRERLYPPASPSRRRVIGLASATVTAGLLAIALAWLTADRLAAIAENRRRQPVTEIAWRETTRLAEQAAWLNPWHGDYLRLQAELARQQALRFAPTPAAWAETYRQVLQYTEQHLHAQPVWALAWRDWLIVKDRLWAYDAAFKQGLVRAAKYGGGFPTVQATVVQIGLREWSGLGEDGQTAVVTMLARGLAMPGKPFRKHRQKLRLLWRMSHAKEAVCRKFPLELTVLCAVTGKG